MNEGGRTINELINEWVRKYLSGESLGDIAEKAGVNHETVRKYLKMSGVTMRSRSEAISLAWYKRCPKKPFNGSCEEKAYMTMFVTGDCSTWRFPSSVRVSASTTHYAQIDLFHDIFNRYCKVSKSPKFNKKRQTYEYGLSCPLDHSFDFLCPKPTTIPEEIRESEKNLLCGLEGYADAEGSIFPYCSRGHTYAAFVLHSKDYSILTTFYETLKKLGYNPYLNTYKNPIYRNYARLGFSGESAIVMLKRLKFHHRERAEAKQLVLKLHGLRWNKTKPEYAAFRGKIREETRQCMEEAREDYILRHGQPHLQEMNQTIPEDIKDDVGSLASLVLHDNIMEYIGGKI